MLREKAEFESQEPEFRIGSFFGQIAPLDSSRQTRVASPDQPSR